MPESKWVRVKDDTTGHEYSISREPFDGETVIDKPAANLQGEPLPAKPNINLARRKASDSAGSAGTGEPAPPPSDSTNDSTEDSTDDSGTDTPPSPEPTTPTGAPRAATSKEKVK
jgi:hypothetical protein